MYIPQRNHLIQIDAAMGNGAQGGEHRRGLVLSSKRYNEQTGLLIFCPVSAGARGGAIEVAVTTLNEPSVVVSSLIQTLSWKDRGAVYLGDAESGVMEEVLVRIIPLIGVDQVIEKFVE